MGKVWAPISELLHIWYGFVGLSWEPIFRLFPFDGFSSLFTSYKKLMRKPCISHMMKYTTGWESNEKSHPFYGQTMGTNFPGLPHSKGFAEFSNAVENFMRKPMPFPCDEVYQGWESNAKKQLYYGKSMNTNFPGSPHMMCLVGY